MRKFKVFVEGRNFLLNGSGGSEKGGFHTCRFLEAIDEADAEDRAIDELRRRKSLGEMTLNTTNDPPTMYVTEIVEVESFGPKGATDNGLIFWIDKNEEEADDGSH